MRDVLVVEDDREVLSAVAGVCRGEGLQVDETVNVEEAVAKLYESNYRVAIVDLMLPRQSGFSLLRGARAGRPSITMVMISGYATLANALESFRLGAFDFLPKPFDVEELLGVVRRALRWGDRDGPPAEPAGAAESEPRLFLGQHSWAMLDADGAATIGAGETFWSVLGEVGRIELPSLGDRVPQGQRLARLEAAEEVYRIWTPLSGRVVAVNERLTESSRLADPLRSEWLARITPSSLETERWTLTRRPAGVAAGRVAG